ncbi:hypothetical protein RI129_005461 [Pyrocoelia pectoralis]|uniref:N-acetyltransferase domain-containing protein n=1 Tax=Pyrocoelia pectoralis TaxID=417401 RepID=A0AAN7ZKF0_9COLE
MSRRLRLESRVLTEEEVHVRDPIELQLKRIYSPLVWKETAFGIRIQDLKENQHDEVINIIKDYYVEQDVLCKNTELLNDEESLDCYLKRIRFQLRDNSSIIAVDLKDEEGDKKLTDEKLKIVGVLVLKIIRKNEFTRVFSQVQLVEGEAMKRCIAFRSHITRRVDVHEKCNCEVFLRYYELCVIPEYRHQSIGHLLMLCGIKAARSYNIPVVAGLFPNFALQKLARRLGMETIYEIKYTEWTDSDGELIFDDPGAGNYTCAVMAGTVAPLPPPPPRPPETQTNLRRPKTRAEKQMSKTRQD